MSDSSIHEMQFERFHSSGGQEWLCPSCGRRLLMKAPPSFEKQVLVPGNTNASHTGGKMDPTLRPWGMAERSEFDLDGFPTVDESHTDAPISLDMLRPWIKWARDAGIDDLWNQAT